MQAGGINVSLYAYMSVFELIQFCIIISDCEHFCQNKLGYWGSITDKPLMMLQSNESVKYYRLFL